MIASLEQKKPPAIVPNFLIAGVAKAGTTALYHYLRQHPDVFMSIPKEPKFLSASHAHPGKGPGDYLHVHNYAASYGEYCKLFVKATGKKAIGEASVDTFFHDDRSIPAIKKYIGDPRILIILRDPVDRAYSAYNYIVGQGFEYLSFKEALMAEDKRCREGYRHMWLYRQGGLYFHRVYAFQENFSQVRVFLYDDLRRDPALLIRSVYQFLNVDPDFVPDMSHEHNVSGVPRSYLFNALFVKPKGLHKAARTLGSAILGENRWIRLRDGVRFTNMQRPGPMDPETGRALRHFYRDDILKLQGCIGIDLSHWLEEEQE